MIKARADGRDGKPDVVILGLSHGNLDRLRAGEPIQFDGTPYGFAGDVLIFSGVNERAMAASLGMNLDGTDDPSVAVHIEPDAP